MKPSILGLGTACPPHKMSQSDALALFTTIACENDRQRRLARAMFRKSSIENRHTIVPYQVAYTWCEPVTVPMHGNRLNDLVTMPDEIPDIFPGESAGPTTGERMQIYSRFAGSLATLSAERALVSAASTAQEITHLVTISCTGFDSPGVDITLINRLGLPVSTQRMNIGFMGCHGAINGLRAALAITESNPTARVLLCAVELCSLHFRCQWDSEGVIGNALFADGAAAIVLGQNSVDACQAETKFASLVDTGSVVIPDSTEAMSWKIGDHGFEMLLTNEVGDRIEATLADWLSDWLATFSLRISDIEYWGVHPGGPRILSAVQTSLDLTDDDLSISREILKQYGNMSSPTVLFILEKFLATMHTNSTPKTDATTSHGVLLAFGPGLVAEIALIEF